MKTYHAVLFLLWITCQHVCHAQPDFTNSYTSYGITFFKDATQRNHYYYLPGNLEIGKSSTGRPDFNFIMMRYVGSAVYDESESIRYRNILSMRLTMQQPDPDSMQLAKEKLTNGRSSLQVRPLPISHIDAMVVFTPVGSDTINVVHGSLSAQSDNGYATSGTYWQERYFTLHLDNHSANLLLHAFKKDYTAISLMYAFYSKGTSNNHVLDVSGHHNLKSELQKKLNESLAAIDPIDSLKTCIVKSDAFAIYLDTLLYPDLITQLDINDAIPPGYAVLNVRNYDFANNLRTDLYEKSVDIEATGAGGNKVSASVSFRATAPDISATNFKFNYAVRLDKPYRYRIRELYKDGREITSAWTDVTIWSALLDITTRPEDQQ